MAASFRRARRWAKPHFERVLYRVAGLPVAVRALFGRDAESAAKRLRAIYAQEFWKPRSAADAIALLVALVVWPFGIIAAAIAATLKNGAVVRERCGKSSFRQFVEQLGSYAAAGILPPWYYVFELYEEGAKPSAYLSRFETKGGVYPILRRRSGLRSALNDKLAFARQCEAHQLPTVPVIAAVENGKVNWLAGDRLPAADLFIKPISGRGGKGADRWDYAAPDVFRNGAGAMLDGQQLLDRLRSRSEVARQLVQIRLTNCAELRDLNNEALSTVRILTCLDEHGRAEAIAAVMRMATGKNNVVDNFHAGGIAAAVDLRSGRLGLASNLGMNARLGWIDRHPDSGAQIAGRVVPQWERLRELAERAHLAFPERVVIGWDIAPTDSGPVIVEGNAAPDLDIVQRIPRRGLADSRLSELLAYHLGNSSCEQARSYGPDAARR